MRLRAAHKDHVWSYDFVAARTHNGRPLRMLTLVDESTRECLAIDVEQRLSNEGVMARLTELFVFRGIPEHFRSDKGSQFTATAVREWLGHLGVKTLCIEPWSPWENGYCESFNGKLRDELLNGEIFESLKEAKVVIETWRRHYNEVRPHSALGYIPPAPPAVLPAGFAVGARARDDHLRTGMTIRGRSGGLVLRARSDQLGRGAVFMGWKRRA